MNLSRFSLCVLSVAGAGVLALCSAWAADRPALTAKNTIERPAEQVVAALSAATKADALANPAVLVAQWSARSVTGVGTPTDDWQTLFTAAASVIVPGTLLYLDRVLSAKRYRLQFTRVAGIATTIEVFYGGTAT